MATIAAYTINGFTRPELTLDLFGNIVLDDTATAFAQTYGLRALYLGCPPNTPYPPVLPSLLFGGIRMTPPTVSPKVPRRIRRWASPLTRSASSASRSTIR
jgi:hypothetical protein